MAKGKKTGGKNFPIGHSGYGGRPPLSPEILEVRKLNKEELISKFNLYMHSNRDFVQSVYDSPETMMIDKSICSLILKGTSDACFTRLLTMYEAMIGESIRPRPVPLLPKDEGPQTHIAAEESPPGDDTEIETYVVMVNRQGKFEHARPRLVQPPKASNE